MAQPPCVEDSCSLDLEINAENKLTGKVILDPDGGLVCTEGDGIGVRLGSAGCGIHASIDGNGLNLGLNYDNGRGLGCDGSGLFVRRHPNACNDLAFDGGQLRVNKYQYRYVSFNTNGGNLAVAGVSNLAFGTIGVDIDAFWAAYGTTARFDIANNGVGQLTNNTCRRMLVEVSYSIVPGYLLGNGWQVWVGAYQDRNYPAGGFSAEAPFVAYDHSLQPLNPGSGLGGDFHPRTYSAGGLILDPGQTITSTIGASLQIAVPGFGTPLGNRVEWRFGCTGRISAWTIS